MAAPITNSLDAIFMNRQLFIKQIDCQIISIGHFQNGEAPELPYLWIDELGTIHCQLCFAGQTLQLENGDDVLTATEFDDLVEQLDQIKLIACFGGLDDALTFCGSVEPGSVANGQPDR